MASVARRAAAVVVGAGPNGLSAAVVLARAGWEVEIREAADSIGGGTRSLPLTLPGFLHDHCSAVHPLAAASPFFASLRLGEHGLRWIDPPVACAHPFDDGTAALLVRSAVETGESVDDASGADGRAWRRLFEPLAAAVEELLRQVPPWRHPLLVARAGLQALLPAQALARLRFRGPRARALLAGVAAHGAAPLERSPTAGVGLALCAAAHAVGWPFPEGGAGRIADALASVLARTGAGASIVTSAPVDSLAQLQGARAVLLDLTPRQVLAIAGDGRAGLLPGRYRRALARYRYGPGAFKVDYALSAPIPWRAAECRQAGTVHLGGSMEEVAAALRATTSGRLAGRPFVLLSQPTLLDPSRAPPGRHVAWAYCHVPSGFAGDALPALEAQIERFAPGFREVVLARAVRGRADLERENGNLVGGDVGAGELSLRQTLLRPAARAGVPWSTPVPGLYLCSASTPPGAGVHGMCGFLAARTALRRAARGAEGFVGRPAD